MRLVSRQGREHRAETRAGKGEAFGDGGGRIYDFRAYGEAAAVFLGGGEPGIRRGDILGRQAGETCVAVDGP